MDSGIDGDKLLILRPDSSSNSSSLDSEELFLSDSAIEEDRDAQLEGISALMEDSETLVDNNKKITVQKVSCEPIQSILTINVLSSVGEGEADKEGVNY